MTDRVAGLLLKAVQHLPPDERDEVLRTLIGGALARPAPATVDRSAHPTAINALTIGIPGRTGPGSGHGPRSPGPAEWAVGLQPLGTRDALGGSLPGEPESALKVLPVRLPISDYDRLRAFSREHGFSMAVIIRTLVERFLDGQARRWATRHDEPDDDLDEETPTGHA